MVVMPLKVLAWMTMFEGLVARTPTPFSVAPLTMKLRNRCPRRARHRDCGDHRLMQLGAAGERGDLQRDAVLFEDAGFGADIGERKMEIVAGGIADADKVVGVGGGNRRRGERDPDDDRCGRSHETRAHGGVLLRHSGIPR